MAGTRSSRADRRRRDDPPRAPVVERRRQTPLTDAVVRSQVSGSELQLFVNGPIIASNCASARAALQQHSARAPSAVVIADLERCTYMDTQGLSVVFEFRRKAADGGRRVILQNPSRAVQRILNITGMHRAFEIRHTSVDLERIPAAKPVPPQDKDTILLPKK